MALRIRLVRNAIVLFALPLAALYFREMFVSLFAFLIAVGMTAWQYAAYRHAPNSFLGPEMKATRFYSARALIVLAIFWITLFCSVAVALYFKSA